MEAKEVETKRQKTQKQNKESLIQLQIKSYQKGLIVRYTQQKQWTTWWWW